MIYGSLASKKWRRAFLWIAAALGLGVAAPNLAFAHPRHHSGTTIAKKAKKVKYHCPMHPDVTSDKPGKCPKCGMELVPEKTK